MELIDIIALECEICESKDFALEFIQDKKKHCKEKLKITCGKCHYDLVIIDLDEYFSIHKLRELKEKIELKRKIKK